MNKYKSRIAFKSIGGNILMLFIFAMIVGIIGYNAFTTAILQQYSDGAYRIADTASDSIDPDKMDQYIEQGESSELYQEVWNRFDKLCNSSSATFVYVIQPDLTDYAHITFIFSTINHNYDYTEYEFGYVRETTNDEYKAKYRLLYEGKSKRELVIRERGFIETDPHITAMIPLIGKDGSTKAILCVQRQMAVLVKTRRNYVKNVVMTTAIITLIVVVGQELYLRRMLLNPLKKITTEASRFAKENIVAEELLTKSIHNKDEIGLLADSIDKMELQVGDYVENLTQITAEKERMGTELALATRIQSDVLPDVFPAFPDRFEFDIYAIMTPAREIGGDFYDYFLIDDDHLCITVADVSGKGVPAALFMMSSKIILANNAMMGKSPADILINTNNSICSNNREEMFVTVWVGVLEISTGILTAANAGHEYPVLKHANGDFSLYKDRHGFVLGGMENMKYREYTMQLSPGDKLFLYTDGVPEATNGNGEMFGAERMLAVLNQHKDASLGDTFYQMGLAIEEFVGEAQQFDDLTMVCLEYKGK